ncbi:MAG: preprotein translocase subunit SecD [Haloarculaceae archaeon]
MNVRENWRIVILAVLVVLSALVLFAPGGGGGAGGNGTVAASTDPTNLQYGLELSGGTRIRAQLDGMTAENVAFTPNETRDVRQSVASELGLDPIDVRVRSVDRESGTVEAFSTNISQERFAEALSAAGGDVSTDQIRNGTTEQTMDTAQNVLDRRINQGGLTGGGATIVRSATGQNFIVVEVPNANRSEVLDLIGEPGRVQIVAGYPVEGDNGTAYERQEVLTQGDFTNISPARQGEGRNPPYVQVTLTDSAAEEYVQVMNQNGFTDEGIGQCFWRDRPDDPGWCLYTVVDDDVTYAASMGDDLAPLLRPDAGGDVAFYNNPTFRMQTTNFTDAQELKINLESGALPTTLDIQSEMFLAPSLAQQFKPLALVTGIVAWLVVSGVVFYRYREIKVAVPLLLTAGAEVFLLLGFATVIGLALDLSHIAGLIAVIGTGVDDLIIIADEILQRGEIKTGRVFKNRFRKAFWVIGAAAATTIIAMSPLAVLSLGDLQGFAIVTIVGVLIGVLVTRPAYGDVLRNLLLEDV